MADLGISIALLAGIVLLSEALRRTASKVFTQTDSSIYLVEIISTFQLCACTHELKLLSEVGHIELQIGLTFTYLMTMVHVLTFRTAICNPAGVLEQVYRRNITGKTALTLIACQFIAAYLARYLVLYFWALGLSDVHLRHKLFGYKCFNPINASLPLAAAVELACAFSMQATVTHIHIFDEKLHVHVISAVITILGYAAGEITGAMFNPVLAFSLQFPCSGHTFLEYSFVYWLGPVLGMASAILLFEMVVPLVFIFLWLQSEVH